MFHPITAGLAGRIACRVVLAVLTFRHRSAVQGVPCRWQAFLVRLSDRRSPVEAIRSVGIAVFRWLLKSGEAFSLRAGESFGLVEFKQTEIHESSMLNKLIKPAEF